MSNQHLLAVLRREDEGGHWVRYSYDRDGLVQTQYVVDVSAGTPGSGDYQGSTVRLHGAGR
ncbi:MAG: hypothetical protein KC593_09360 [Myxococcales bacterium]|nr:hypothetical protein [Myxococcales bacterium]